MVCTLNYIVVVVAESKWRCMKPQECNICHKTFSNAGNLRQHITNVHTPGQPVRCELCSKEFKNKEYLRKHKVIIHKAPLRKQKLFPINPNMIQWNYWTQNFQQWLCVSLTSRCVRQISFLVIVVRLNCRSYCF